MAVDNGLYDSAVDTYDGDGTTSYDFPYLITRKAWEAIGKLPHYEATLPTPQYTLTIPIPTYTLSYPLPVK